MSWPEMEEVELEKREYDALSDGLCPTCGRLNDECTGGCDGDFVEPYDMWEDR